VPLYLLQRYKKKVAKTNLLATFSVFSITYSTFANGEVKEFKEVREVKAKCFTDKSSTKNAVGYNF